MTREEARAIRRQIVTMSARLTDEEAASYKWAFDLWNENGHRYLPGERFVWEGELYKVKDGMEHTSQSDWTPDTAVSLYERVARPDEDGTRINPIAYDGNMELFAGKYYSQGGNVYLCTRDTGIAVYHALTELVGIYVIAAE